MPLVKAVLFDMDGTLVDSSDAWFALFNRARERFGKAPVTREVFERDVWGCPFEEELRMFFPDVDGKEVLEFYEGHYLDAADHLRLIEGVEEVLAALADRDIPAAVVTNTHRPLALKVLGRLGIARWFKDVVGGDEVEHGKPAPDMVLLGCERVGVGPDEALFVGDTEADVQAGQAAEVMTLCLGPHGENRISCPRDALDHL
jgi:HAD superfamily hydrolase (TIGR01509 family)